MSGGQKFIARNRAPRVQIEYDVELYGAEKKVQLPFVMGVMSDLSGKAEKPAVGDRGFLEIDVDNFDDRMRAVAPRAQFSVPNTLTGEGNLSVDLTFSAMADFTPAAVASKVDALRPLLEARQQLSALTTYMDGKAGAEALIETILSKPELLAALAGAGENGGTEGDVAATLAGLAAQAPAASEKEDGTDAVLDSLARQAPEPGEPEKPDLDAVLSTVEQPAPDPEPQDSVETVLADIERREVAEDSAVSEADAVLAGIEAVPEPDEVTGDTTQAVFDSVPEVEASLDPRREDVDDILQGIEAVAEPPQAEAAVDQVLSQIEPVAEPEPTDPQLDSILGDLSDADVPEAAQDTSTDDILSGLEAPAVAGPATTQTDDILSALGQPEPITASDDADLDAVLGGLDTPPDTAADEGGDISQVLSGIDTTPAPEQPSDTSLDDILAGVDTETQPSDGPDDDLDAILGDLEPVAEDGQDQTDSTESVLAGIGPVADPVAEPADSDDLDAILGDLEPADVGEPEQADSADSVLAGIAPAPEPAGEGDDLDDILAGVGVAETPAQAPEVYLSAVLDTVSTAAPEPDAEDVTDGLLGDAEVSSETEATGSDDLDDLLGGLDTGDAETGVEDVRAQAGAAPPQAEPEGEGAAEPVNDELDDVPGMDVAPDPEADAAGDDLDALLSGVSAEPQTVDDEADDLDDLLAGFEATPDPVSDGDDAADPLPGSEAAGPSAGAEDDLDAFLSAAGSDSPETPPGDDLDDLLGGVSDAPEVEAEADDLDDLLAGFETTPEPDTSAGATKADPEPAEPEPEAEDDLDDLLAGFEPTAPADQATESEAAAPIEEADDLDDLLAGFETEGAGDPVAESEEPDTTSGSAETVADEQPPQSPFGMISAPRPVRSSLHRPVFRMALLGDFTGRAAQGKIETGDALASRKPILLDVDTVDEVIEGFATRLTLAIGAEQTRVEVPLDDLDACHPDELYDNVSLFQEVSGLRQQLNTGSMADSAAATLKSWSETYAVPVRLPKTSAATSVPANLKLSDFQALIGDTRGTAPEAGTMDSLIAQIVGPHVVKAPDAGAAELKTSVDAAMQTAMRLVLHHPEFQALESQWRSLDLLARRIETDSMLQIVLYDVSAEELAADLAAKEDLSDSGFYRLMAEPLDPETGAGGYSAMLGLYTFEETPPHAELLARIGTVAAHFDAPFFSAITPGYLETDKEDRHPLVAKAWDALRRLPAAAYLGLSSPRFLLRLPYGRRTDPVSVFDFEEFSLTEGLRSMLWANPVVLVAILLAATHKKDPKSPDLGSVMSLGDLPFHYVTDRHGDQVALPCTERNLTSDAAQHTINRGFMPVVWMKGRNEIRLGSFQSLAGTPVSGPWSEETAASAQPEAGAKVQPDLEQDFPVPDAPGQDTPGEEASLDDLLAGFEDTDGAAAGDDGEMDPELAALLEGL